MGAVPDPLLAGTAATGTGVVPAERAGDDLQFTHGFSPFRSVGMGTSEASAPRVPCAYGAPLVARPRRTFAQVSLLASRPTVPAPPWFRDVHQAALQAWGTCHVKARSPAGFPRNPRDCRHSSFPHHRVTFKVRFCCSCARREGLDPPASFHEEGALSN